MPSKCFRSEKIAVVFLPAAASERRPDSLRGPCGGSDGEERFSGVGDGVQRGLGNHGSHGSLSSTGPGLCQQRFSGEGHQNMKVLIHVDCISLNIPLVQMLKINSFQLFSN